MQVEAEKFYLNRSGQVVGPIQPSRRMPDDVPFFCGDVEYERDGRARQVFKMLPDLDLICEAGNHKIEAGNPPMNHPDFKWPE